MFQFKVDCLHNDARNAEVVGKHVELVFKPFAPVPKLYFENVDLGKSKSIRLVIRNPANEVLQLYFTKLPKSDFKFTLNDEDKEIGIMPFLIRVRKNGTATVDIEWKPSEIGNLMEVCQLINSLHGIKLSVHLIGKCVQVKNKVHRSKNPTELIKHDENSTESNICALDFNENEIK